MTVIYQPSNFKLGLRYKHVMSYHVFRGAIWLYEIHDKT